MDYQATTPPDIAAAIASELGRAADYDALTTDGADRPYVV
jgi:hypothetical protein